MKLFGEVLHKLFTTIKHTSKKFMLFVTMLALIITISPNIPMPIHSLNLE